MRKKLLAFVVLVLLVGLMSGCLLMPKPKDPDTDPDPEGPVVLFEETFDYASSEDLVENWWIPEAWAGKGNLQMGVSPVEGEEDVKVAVAPVPSGADARCGVYTFDEPYTDCILEIEFYDSDAISTDTNEMVFGGLFNPGDNKTLFVGIHASGASGVDRTQGGMYYAYRNQIGGGGWALSSVERTEGWHTIKYVVTSAGTSVYMDGDDEGSLVCQITSVTEVPGVFLGSLWQEYDIPGYFRAVRIIELED